MKKAIDYFCRFFVGALLIFSGLIKLNDPVGTQIKLEEYFEVFAEDFGSFFHHFVPWALEIGLIMILLEVVLGVAILMYWKMNLTAWTTLLMMLFFTFLTFYSAFFNKVTDCGCFGDFIKLTPWTSFAKDIVLDVFILHLFWHRRSYRPKITGMAGHLLIIGVLLISLFLGLYAVRHLPFIDFRTYKIGNNIPEQMVPEETPIFEYVFTKDGKEIKSDKFLSASDGYQYVSSHVTNQDKITPPISDFSVTTYGGDDITSSMFEGGKLMIVIVDATKTSTEYFPAMSELTKKLEGQVDCMILTASIEPDVEAIRHEYQLAIPPYLVDATVLKTIVRSNPGITVWKDGVVKGKWHFHDVPSVEEVLSLTED